MNIDAADRSASWWRRIAIAVLLIGTAASLLNAYRYTQTVANPVIVADAWYFVDVFVSKQLDGTLSWRDYFVKRESSDHAQPLHKLWLAANARWFELDFRLDALVGFGGLVLCVLMLCAVALRDVGWRGIDGPRALILALIPLQLFSLNSRETFTWPLVMQYYLVLPFALYVFWVASVMSPVRAWLLFASALAALVVLDGGGILATIAAALTLALRGWRTRSAREALRGVVACVLAIVLYKVASALWLPPVAVSASAGVLQSLGMLLDHPASAWKLVAIPAAASLIHWDTMAWMHGESSLSLVAALGALVSLLHVAFWWSAWRTVGASRTTVFACALMLYVYGMLAGIVVARVPVYGPEYLWQSRYVAFFQLANVALVLQWLATTTVVSAHGRPSRDGMWAMLVPSVALTLMIWVQTRVSDHAWILAPHVRNYVAATADTLFCLARDPYATAIVCEPHQTVCDWSPAVRARLVGLLHQHQLNVFSPRLQQRFAMQPDPDKRDICLASTVR